MEEYNYIALIQNEGSNPAFETGLVSDFPCKILYTCSIDETTSLPAEYLNNIFVIFCDINRLQYDDELKSLEKLISSTKSHLVFITKPDTVEELYKLSLRFKPAAFVSDKSSPELVKATIENYFELRKNNNKALLDISNYQKQVVNLKKSEEQFRQVWDKSLDGMRLVDVNGKTLLVNDAFCKLVEKKKEDLEGYDFSEIYNYSIEEIADPEIRKSILKKFKDRILADEIEPNFEKELFLWNNKKVWFQLSNSILKQNDGSRVVLSIFRDISENKKNEEKLNKIASELKELNDSKDKFISILSHDLRGPFHGFLGITEVLANDIDSLSTEEIAESAAVLHKALNNQYLLLEDLLTWSGIQTKRIEFNFEKIKVVDEIISIIVLLRPNADKKNIKIFDDIPDDILVVCDRAMLKLLFRNLIANALKFSYEGDEVKISAQKRNGGVLLKVTDHGVGIAETDIKKLFRTDIHFTTTGTADEAGTGLGLILCKEIIDLHKGKIWVDSVLGKGSTFNVFFPLSE